ncbi:MAG: hypothetical protein GYA14_12875 [Ignavibacteria bacterium]|nr:hypothetical protein [Ignavibacteria bacterium]
MTNKKFWNWTIDPAGNLITESGKFKLIQVDENNLPIKPLTEIKSGKSLIDKGKNIFVDKLQIEKKPEINTKVTLINKIILKFPAIKNLLIGIIDLFSKGAASKIESSLNNLLTNEDEKNINQLNIGDNKMIEAIKTFIVSKLLQWILKAGGGVLAGLGISNGSVEEILTGATIFILSVLWSLIKTGKIALTDPNEFLKLK